GPSCSSHYWINEGPGVRLSRELSAEVVDLGHSLLCDGAMRPVDNGKVVVGLLVAVAGMSGLFVLRGSNNSGALIAVGWGVAAWAASSSPNSTRGLHLSS